MSSFFTLRSSGGTNAGEEVGAQDAHREDNQYEGDHKIDERRQELAHLQRDTAEVDGEGRQTLARGRGGCQQGRDDILRQRREELGNHRREVERGSQDDNILVIKHFIH